MNVSREEIHALAQATAVTAAQMPGYRLVQ
jgi:hypothetical protein